MFVFWHYGNEAEQKAQDKCVQKWASLAFRILRGVIDATFCV